MRCVAFRFEPVDANFGQMCEAFALMQDIMVFSKENPTMTLSQNLTSCVAQKQQAIMTQGMQSNPAMMQHMQGRMPGGQMMGQVAMSPAMAAGMLPNAVNGSPHLSAGGSIATQSPVPAHMAPPMQAQASQQGSTTGASANTSPNISNKRRRSTVKVKGEEEGEMNGTSKKVKTGMQMKNANRGKN